MAILASSRAEARIDSFLAVPMPDGDPQFGVPGALIMLVERTIDPGATGPKITRTRIYSLAEAEALRDALAGGIARLRDLA